MTNEPQARQSHVTAWIVVSIAAMLLLYLVGYPWAYWGWFHLLRKPPHWLYALGDPWRWAFLHSDLRPYGLPYWHWSYKICMELGEWLSPSRFDF